jgi:signal transduction histidine kinase
MIISDHAPIRRVEASDSRLYIPRRIALIDAHANIVAVNKDWLEFAEETGLALKRIGPGVNYLQVCRQLCGSPATSRKILIGIHDVLKGKAGSFVMDYASQTSQGRAYFRIAASPMVYGNVRVAVAHTDITDLQQSREKDYKRLQDFARRLIHAQEEERQRISREIHDDVGNRLALMSLSLRRFMQQSSDGPGSNVHELSKVLDGINDLSTVMRNLSHRLHPAPLRHLGIGAALKSLLHAFKQTHGMQIDVVIPPGMPRLPDEVELCIFRITQECLQNIIRHSGADHVRIVLAHSARQVRLTVSDTGRGFVPSEAIRKGGFGLLSMEERALSIGARLTTSSSPGVGTEIRLTVPLERAHAQVVQA